MKFIAIDKLHSKKMIFSWNFNQQPSSSHMTGIDWVDHQDATWNVQLIQQHTLSLSFITGVQRRITKVQRYNLGSDCLVEKTFQIWRANFRFKISKKGPKRSTVELECHVWLEDEPFTAKVAVWRSDTGRVASGPGRVIARVTGRNGVDALLQNSLFWRTRLIPSSKLFTILLIE